MIEENLQPLMFSANKKQITVPRAKTFVVFFLQEKRKKREDEEEESAEEEALKRLYI